MALKVASLNNAYAPTKPMEDAGIQVTKTSCKTGDEVIAALRDCDGALVSTWPLTDRKVLETCTKLKVVSRMGVGVDSIDLKAATELGVVVCNTPGVNTTEVADHAMAMLLAITRRLIESNEFTKAGKWGEDAAKLREFQTTSQRIAGSTVGILGLGNIGRAFATRVKGFGPERIIAHDPYIPQTTADLYGVKLVDLDTLLRQSDFITIHAPATKDTHHLFNKDTFARMKKTAVLINCARGPIVDPVALHAALRDGVIRAAGLDVFETEPVDAEDPLLSLPNLLVTPHLAGWSPTFIAESGRKQAENVAFVLTGRKPHGIANPEVIKTIAVMRATNPGRWKGVPDFSTATEW
jgi:D-3-phosphoglycerate dehydrogenase